MTNVNPHPPEEQDDAETAAFVQLGRLAVALGDPVPTEVTELAKLAFEFCGIETVDFVDTSELAGVRSGAAVANALQASRGDTTVIWSVEDGHLTGVVHSPATTSVSVQTLSETAAVELDQADGSFDTAAPGAAYRLVINDGEEWATPWTD